MSDPDVPPDMDALRVHYGEGGAVDAAWTWVQAIASADTFAAAWCDLTGDPLRTEVAAGFVQANIGRFWMTRYADRHGLASAIARCSPPDDDVWQRFVEAQPPVFAHALEAALSGRAGAGAHTRLVAPGLEIVVLVETDGRTVGLDGDPMNFLVMQHDGTSWRVIGFNDPAYLEHVRV